MEEIKTEGRGGCGKRQHKRKEKTRPEQDALQKKKKKKKETQFSRSAYFTTSALFNSSLIPPLLFFLLAEFAFAQCVISSRVVIPSSLNPVLPVSTLSIFLVIQRSLSHRQTLRSAGYSTQLQPDVRLVAEQKRAVRAKILSFLSPILQDS